MSGPALEIGRNTAEKPRADARAEAAIRSARHSWRIDGKAIGGHIIMAAAGNIAPAMSPLHRGAPRVISNIAIMVALLYKIMIITASRRSRVFDVNSAEKEEEKEARARASRRHWRYVGNKRNGALLAMLRL